MIDVRTPHIGGVVELRNLDAEFSIAATLPGYTSHVNRTRNVDMAVVGNFDTDAELELLLPDRSRRRLAAIGYQEEGLLEKWSLPLNGTLQTNVAVARSPAGRLAVGVGRSDGMLRIWR